MKINIKQKQLAEELFARVKEKYPELVFKNYDFSPDDPEHLWINVIADIDEEREIEMTRFCSEIETDILMDYGYAISIMPDNPNLVYA